MKKTTVMILSLVLSIVVVGAAWAAERPLTIAFRGDAATLDPHGRLEATSLNIQAHIFRPLIFLDPQLKLVPDQALSWKALDDLTWEFKLKPGVKFHNGEPFNAQAAKFSLERAKNHPKSQMKALVPNCKEMVAVDETTLRLVTQVPQPELPLMLSYIHMVPPKYYAEKDDATAASKPVGSGPYKFVEWVKDDYLKVALFEGWTGPKPDFSEVVFKPIPEDATRVAALLSGEIDVCFGVSIPDIPRVEKNKGTYIDRCPSQRVIYLMFDVFTEKGGPAPQLQPGLPAGKPNPFRDKRVRQAMGHAVNVDDLIKYVMEGSAYPATQIISSFAPGFNPAIKRPAFDPALAKKLLQEAGFGGGFEVNLDAPNDRYINDQPLAEAIAGQLSKVGIKVNVVATPKAVFFPKIDKYESPFMLVGWGLLSWGGTINTFFREQKGQFGRNNRGRFKDAELEKKIDQANQTMNDQERLKLQHAAMAQAMETSYMIPLHYEENVNGYSDKIKGKARTDEYVFAWEIKKVK